MEKKALSVEELEEFLNAKNIDLSFTKGRDGWTVVAETRDVYRTALFAAHGELLVDAVRYLIDDWNDELMRNLRSYISRKFSNPEETR